jgi:hypothetical protein
VILVLCVRGYLYAEQAVSIAIAGFEGHVLRDGQELEGNVPRWDITDGVGGVINPTTAAFPNEAHKGNSVLYLMNYGGSVFQALYGSF